MTALYTRNYEEPYEGSPRIMRLDQGGFMGVSELKGTTHFLRVYGEIHHGISIFNETYTIITRFWWPHKFTAIVYQNMTPKCLKCQISKLQNLITDWLCVGYCMTYLKVVLPAPPAGGLVLNVGSLDIGLTGTLHCIPSGFIMLPENKVIVLKVC